MPTPDATAQEITKQSNSNLAFALYCLPKERRGDLEVFYAFCRIIDDIADDLDLPVSEKQEGFQHWKNGLQHGFPPELKIENEVTRIRDEHHIPTELFLEIIAGCEMDLAPLRFQTWEDLQVYTYKVACAVGLISLHLFGAAPDRARPYALKLGHALQLTNIIRDVGEDLDNGERIYLPLADLTPFDLTEQDLIKRTYDERFTAMMAFQTQRARTLYAEAAEALPEADKKPLKAAQIMGAIYSRTLDKIEAKRFSVYHQRISLSKPQKISLLLKGMLLGA